MGFIYHLLPRTEGLRLVVHLTAWTTVRCTEDSSVCVIKCTCNAPRPSANGCISFILECQKHTKTGEIHVQTEGDIKEFGYKQINFLILAFRCVRKITKSNCYLRC